MLFFYVGLLSLHCGSYGHHSPLYLYILTRCVELSKHICLCLHFYAGRSTIFLPGIWLHSLSSPQNTVGIWKARRDCAKSSHCHGSANALFTSNSTEMLHGNVSSRSVELVYLRVVRQLFTMRWWCECTLWRGAELLRCGSYFTYPLFVISNVEDFSHKVEMCCSTVIRKPHASCDREYCIF
jgi:hypothetical protein